MKDILLRDITEPEIKGIMEELYDLVVSGKSTNEEREIFMKTIEVASRVKILENQLAMYESYLN